jgi:predicted RNA-binding Zn-ribbon protein involved in translation (DUF1610 family)
MRSPTWAVLDYGDVPQTARTIEYDCPKCGREALLPVLGSTIAQIPGGSVVFDGPGKLPRTIRCRKCRSVFTTDRE